MSELTGCLPLLQSLITELKYVQKRLHWRQSDIVFVNLELIQLITFMFLLLTFKKWYLKQVVKYVLN